MHGVSLIYCKHVWIKEYEGIMGRKHGLLGFQDNEIPTLSYGKDFEWYGSYYL